MARAAINLDGADYLAFATEMISPIEDAIYLNIFGDVDPGRNLAPDGLPGRIVGAPRFGSSDNVNQNFVLFDQNSWVDTLIADQTALTVFVGMMANSVPFGNYGYIVGSYDAAGKIGFNIFVGNDGTNTVNALVGRRASNGSVSTDYVTTGSVTHSPRLFCVRAADNYATRMDDLTVGTMAQQPAPVLPRSLSDVPLRLGRPGITGDNFNALINMWCICIVPRVVLDVEMAAMSKALLAIAAARKLFG
jgi:hypothetical protein